MFQFSHTDLDFGIFRILKIKREEVNQFIDEKLTTIVEDILSTVTDELYDSQLTEVREYIDKEGGSTEKGYLNDISANQLNLIEFLTYKRQDHLLIPLKTDPDTLKAQLAFKVYNHIHSFLKDITETETLAITIGALRNIRWTTQMKLTITGQMSFFIGNVETVIT